RFVSQLESLRETQRSERLAGGEVNLALGADDHLRAAAADVDAERGAVADVDGRTDGAENVVGFFLGGDHADFDARGFADEAEELAAVGRLAHRARGDGDDLVRVPTLRDL